MLDEQTKLLRSTALKALENTQKDNKAFKIFSLNDGKKFTYNNPFNRSNIVQPFRESSFITNLTDEI